MDLDFQSKRRRKPVKPGKMQKRLNKEGRAGRLLALMVLGENYLQGLGLSQFPKQL